MFYDEKKVNYFLFFKKNHKIIKFFVNWSQICLFLNLNHKVIYFIFVKIHTFFHKENATFYVYFDSVCTSLVYIRLVGHFVNVKSRIFESIIDFWAFLVYNKYIKR